MHEESPKEEVNVSAPCELHLLQGVEYFLEHSCGVGQRWTRWVLGTNAYRIQGSVDKNQRRRLPDDTGRQLELSLRLLGLRASELPSGRPEGQA